MFEETFPGRYESLAKIAKFVTQAAVQAGLNETAIFAVQMSVDEACSNIIEHAYGGENIGDIDCTCKIDSQGLTVILHDWGAPFDPEKVPEPDLTSPLEKRKEGGLGLFFIRKLMDEVHFEFSAEKGNTLTMVKRKEDAR
jgi:anti-sigma regulatory factor (Ser/Thr protein kinase)